jgi:hypothetical protein
MTVLAVLDYHDENPDDANSVSITQPGIAAASQIISSNYLFILLVALHRTSTGQVLLFC